eukprot:TRINITY_DN2145_c0_g1_i2.p1 TRINITY_DN2145_c0_g1~~TRINITY_DN2145_c0_g1_i2.p1  ORF type:complete len:399 (+),score=82.75 TRINITY_DN2145_c0_g1_i2:219-1415(+)
MVLTRVIVLVLAVHVTIGLAGSDFQSEEGKVAADLHALKEDVAASHNLAPHVRQETREVMGEVESFLSSHSENQAPLPQVGEPCHEKQSVCQLKEACGDAGFWLGKCHGKGYCCKTKPGPKREECAKKCHECDGENGLVRKAQCTMFAGPVVHWYCNAHVAKALKLPWGKVHSPCETRIFALNGRTPEESKCSALCVGSKRTGAGKEDVTYGAKADKAACKKCLYQVCRVPCIAAEKDYVKCQSRGKAGILFQDECNKRCVDLCLLGGHPGPAPVVPSKEKTKAVGRITFKLSEHGYVIGASRGHIQWEAPFSARKVKCMINYDDSPRFNACMAGTELADDAQLDKVHFRSPGPKGLCQMDCHKHQKSHAKACQKGCDIGLSRSASAVAGSGDLTASP